MFLPQQEKVSKCLPAKGRIIEQRFCRGEKKFDVAVLVTMELDEPQAEKALLVFKFLK